MRNNKEIINKVCDLCGHEGYTTLLKHDAASFTSDTRIVNKPIEKIICHNCALIRNKFEFDFDQLMKHYKEDYQLGKDANVKESVFYTADGKVSRSKAVYDWINESIKKSNADINLNSLILELGCGEGSLLERFTEEGYKNVSGLELNLGSVNIAREKGLNVNGGGFDDVVGKYDLIFSFAVIEHVPSPNNYFKKLSKHLNDGGILILSQPIQDTGNIDVYFVDHLHHFHSKHLTIYGVLNDYKVLYSDNEHKFIKGFSIHIFSLLRNENRKDIGLNLSFTDGYKELISSTIVKWEEEFEVLKQWIENNRRCRIAVFGVGQMFNLLMAYTNTNINDFEFGVDDNLNRYSSTYSSLNIIDSSTFFNNEFVGKILITFKPDDKLLNRFRERKIEYIIFNY